MIKIFLLNILFFSFTSCMSFKNKQNAFSDSSKWQMYTHSNNKAIHDDLEEASGNAKEALSNVLEKIKKKPKDTLLLSEAARLALMSGDKKQAEKFADNISNLDFRNVEARILKANLSYLNNNASKALLILNLEKGENSKNIEILNLLAGVYLHNKNDKKSIDVLVKTIKLDPTFAAAHMNLGLLYFKHKEFEKASREFEAVSGLIKNNFVPRMHQAVCYAALKDYDKAQKIYDALLSQNKRHSILLYNMAVLKLRQKKYEEAISFVYDYLDYAPKQFLAKKPAIKLLNEIRYENADTAVIKADKVDELAQKIASIEDAKSEISLFDQIEEQYFFTAVGYVGE